ncbi:MAG: hypothetical protein H7X77_06935 [Anaerolineae bacterium]|nr:hypothetical protein [Anaerolineae bacterium]
MDDEYLKQFLTRRAEQEIPATMDLQSKIQAQLAGQNTPRRLPQPRWRQVTLIAAAALVATTAMFALAQTLIQPDAGINAVLVENQIVQIDTTQPITVSSPLNSLTVTLDYAHADANRITVAYEIAGNAAADTGVEIFSNPTLISATGQTFSWIPGSIQQTTATQAENGETFTHGGIISFDASGITGNPATLALSLRLDVAYSMAELRANDPYGMMMAGDTTFNFNIPFNPGRVVAINQSFTAGSQTIEVQQAVIAPSLTRLEVCFSTAEQFAVDAWLSWELPVSLSVNGQPVLDNVSASFAGLNGQPLEADAACRALVIPAALTQQTGVWTLSLNGFHNTESGAQLPGSGTITFNIN